MTNHHKPPPGFGGTVTYSWTTPDVEKFRPNLQKWGGPGGRSQARTGLTVHPGDCVAIDESGTYSDGRYGSNNWKAADGSAGDDFLKK